jgi:hypothetical protein
MARLEGRNMTMVLSPEKKAVKKPSPKPAAPATTTTAPVATTALVEEAPVSEAAAE